MNKHGIASDKLYHNCDILFMLDLEETDGMKMSSFRDDDDPPRAQIKLTCCYDDMETNDDDESLKNDTEYGQLTKWLPKCLTLLFRFPPPGPGMMRTMRTLNELMKCYNRNKLDRDTIRS